jgi:DNA polymerase-1
MKHTVIIDSFGCFFTSFYAMPAMHSPMMEPTNATYGFCRDLFAILGDFKPTRIFCAFDLAGKGFRREIYKEYKANRGKVPDDLQTQIPFIEEVINAFNIPVLKCEGFEADDIIATVAATASPENLVTIVTSDKDCRQLLGEHVRLFNLRKKEFYTVESLKTDWRIAPDQCIDFQALCGDSSDNIPGARGIGQKTATELLQKYGGIEGIYQNIVKVVGKRRDYLINSKADVEVSKKLVTLRKDAPIEIPSTPYVGYNRDSMAAMFKRFGFDSLYSHLTPTVNVLNFHLPTG